MTPPRKSSALPPAGWRGASPKAISGRTSYLRVRLEFLRYPRLLPTLFNGCGSGPPPPFTAASAWTWIGHPVSGLRCPTPCRACRLRALHARSRFGSAALRLNLARQRNSPDRSTKSTRSRPSGAPAACRRRVSGSLSLPSRGPFHLSFTVLCSIGHWAVFSLAGWSPLLPARFLVSRSTLDPAAAFRTSRTGPSPSPAALPRAVPLCFPRLSAVLTPPCTHGGLGPSRFARRYSGNRCFFLFLRLLRCFSSPGSPRAPMDSARGAQGLLVRVSPFRHLRIFAHLPLPAAFRSLSRLSSAPSAKASALRPFLLGPPAPRLAWRRAAFCCFFFSLLGFLFRCSSVDVSFWYSVFKVRPRHPPQWA